MKIQLPGKRPNVFRMLMCLVASIHAKNYIGSSNITSICTNNKINKNKKRDFQLYSLLCSLQIIFCGYLQLLSTATEQRHEQGQTSLLSANTSFFPFSGQQIIYRQKVHLLFYNSYFCRTQGERELLCEGGMFFYFKYSQQK